MLLKIALFLAFIVYAAEAYPNKPGCTLVVSGSNKNVMTTNSIMGQAPTEPGNLISFDTSTYNQGDAKITVTLANLASGVVVHTSAGTLSKEEGSQATPTDDNGNAWNAVSGCTTKMFNTQTAAATLTLYLTVPSDITSVSSITVSVLTAGSYGAVKRQKLLLTNTVTTTTSTAAPTTTTTQGPTPSPGPTTTAGPTTTSTAAPTTTQGPTTSPGPTTTEIGIAARATSSLVLFILPLLTLFYISC